MPLALCSVSLDCGADIRDWGVCVCVFARVRVCVCVFARVRVCVCLHVCLVWVQRAPVQTFPSHRGDRSLAAGQKIVARRHPRCHCYECFRDIIQAYQATL